MNWYAPTRDFFRDSPLVTNALAALKPAVGLAEDDG